MAHPVVYDVIVRSEIEAKDKDHAVNWLVQSLREGHIKKVDFEVIRDDNAFPPKDFQSRETNGFVVLSSRRRHALFDEISAALAAAKSGDSAKGEALLESLREEFAYLNLGSETLL